MCVCSKLPKIRVLIGISRTEVTKDVFAKWAFNKSLRLIPPCTSTSDPTPKDLLWALLLWPDHPERRNHMTQAGTPTSHSNPLSKTYSQMMFFNSDCPDSRNHINSDVHLNTPHSTSGNPWRQSNTDTDMHLNTPPQVIHEDGATLSLTYTFNTPHSTTGHPWRWSNTDIHLNIPHSTSGHPWRWNNTDTDTHLNSPPPTDSPGLTQGSCSSGRPGMQRRTAADHCGASTGADTCSATTG